MRRNILALVLATVVLMVGTGAQAQYAGKWALELGEWQATDGREIRMPGGNSGVLEVSVAGDSASGTFTTEGGPAPLVVRGKVEGGKLRVSGQRQARRNINGAESTVEITISFELTRTGDELGGEMQLATKDEPPLSRSVTGKPAV
jgi:hypothetical protein